MDRSTTKTGSQPRSVTFDIDRGLLRRVVCWFAAFHHIDYEEAHRRITEGNTLVPRNNMSDTDPTGGLADD